LSEHIRQLKLLDPSKIGDKSITLVGCGATGSFLAKILSKMGWGNLAQGQGELILIDGDKVEEHNLCNQDFEIGDIGKFKAVALADSIYRSCGWRPTVVTEMVTPETDKKLLQSNYVGLMVDTMAARKMIFESFLKYSFTTDLVIEPRTGIKDGRIYAFSPNSVDQRTEWFSTLYTDEVADESGCGASEAIISTIMYMASLASQRIVQHFNQTYGSDNLHIKGQPKMKMWNEVQFSLYPESLMMRIFGSGDMVFAQQETENKQETTI